MKSDIQLYPDFIKALKDLLIKVKSQNKKIR